MKNLSRSLLKLNLFFIFIFLNIWDFVVSRQFLNAMSIGIVMFGPSAILWLVGNWRAAALVTLISIFELVIMIVFVVEGFELGGAATTLKSIFWIPYLVMAAVNTFWGLKIYSEHRESQISRSRLDDSRGLVR